MNLYMPSRGVQSRLVYGGQSIPKKGRSECDRSVVRGETVNERPVSTRQINPHVKIYIQLGV